MQRRQCFYPPRSAKSGCNICRQWWRTGVEVLGKLLQLEKLRIHLRHLRTTVLKMVMIQNVSVQTVGVPTRRKQRNQNSGLNVVCG